MVIARNQSSRRVAPESVERRDIAFDLATAESLG
jgi:hypothetical protein